MAFGRLFLPKNLHVFVNILIIRFSKAKSICGSQKNIVQNRVFRRDAHGETLYIKSSMVSPEHLSTSSSTTPSLVSPYEFFNVHVKLYDYRDQYDFRYDCVTKKKKRKNHYYCAEKIEPACTLK